MVVTDSKSLLERIGGIPFLKLLINSLYDEMLESPELGPFFRGAPIETLKTHQSVLFRMVAGSKKSQPQQDKLTNYLLASHSRLFRDKGLNEAHFDLFIGCLLISLQSFLVDQCIIEEFISIVSPLRVVFEYGAKVASKEKEIGPEERKYLPPCSAATIGTDTPSILPHQLMTDEPAWLVEELRKVKSKRTLRDWTCKLSDRCSATGDVLLADVMMDIPIFQLEVYMGSFVQLAFLPDNIDDTVTAEIVRKLRYPRGYSNESLSRSLFDRLVNEFAKTCDDMDVKKDDIKKIVEKLRRFRKSFSKSDSSLVNGISNPSKMLVDDGPKTVVKFIEDLNFSSLDNQKNENERRGSFCSKSSGVSNNKSLEPISSPQKKNGVSKWFALRKASMDMKQMM